MPFVVGETIGSYRITEQLGQGGMATVFKAYHPLLERYVALKALHPAFKEDATFLGRFAREALVVARLEHPNIVQIFDFAEHEGRPYLVMKYIEGETLKARLNRGSLSKGEIIDIVDAVGAALSYAHRQGILHRDVKPSNVLLGKDGVIYLADFGLARIAQVGESTLSTDMLVGTPQYISPEQAVGKKDLDAGTDIYSFGVMLYEMVVGKVPFNADTPYAIIHDHIYTPLPMPRSVNPQVPEAIERVLLKALAKERTDRYMDVTGIVEAFKKALEEMPLLETTEVMPVQVATTLAAPISAQQSLPLPESDKVSPAPVIPPPVIVSAPEPTDIQHVIEPISPQPAVKTSKTKSKPRTKIPVWVFIVVGLVILCGCSWVGVRFYKPLRQRILRAASPISTPTPPPANSLETALNNVEKNPNDPLAHIDLARVYLDFNQPESALRELTLVKDLVGPNRQFFMDVGNQTAKDGQWHLAAWCFLRAATASPDPLPDNVRSRMHEAIYKAYQKPEASILIPPESIRESDPSMAAVAEAEREFWFGSKVNADALTSALLVKQEDFPEARLLRALVIMEQDPDLGKNILRDLRRDETIAEWIRVEATRILNKP